MDSKELRETIDLMRLSGTDLQYFEVKASRNKLSESIPETLSAFSNGSGGYLILGLSEREGFTPLPDFDAERMQDALSTACEKLTPHVRPDISIKEFEGVAIIVAEIPEMAPVDKPCYITDRGRYAGAYIRTGDGDRRLSNYEIDRLMEERRQPRFDVALVPEATMEDLDVDMVAALLKRERDKHGSVFGKLSDEDALLNLGAVKRDADGVVRPTLCGLLTLGIYPQKYYPRLCVTFASFPGTGKSEIVSTGRRLLDSQTLVGNIPTMIKDAIDVVSNNMRTGALIEGAFRVDVPDYPLVAVREAIANALMHRDYSPESQGTQVQVNMYADRLEIYNPGGLYGTVTVDQLGKSGISSTRNQYLAALLESTPYPDGGWVVENRGTGYMEIEARLSEALMAPPIPKDSISAFTLVLTRRHLMPAEMKGSSTPDVRAAILDMLEKSGSVSTREIMSASGLSRAGVMRYINRLLAENLIEPTEPGRSPRQRYRLLRKHDA